jgi:hypothetical protein
MYHLIGGSEVAYTEQKWDQIIEAQRHLQLPRAIFSCRAGH